MSTTKIIYSLNVDKTYIENIPGIKEKIYDTSQQSYVILSSSEMGEKNEQDYHSVILEHPSRRLLSFAPPKNMEYSNDMDFQLFFGKSEEETEENPTDSIYINEFVEGTFIHLFYDTRISCWEIATKRAIGGKYSYFHIPESQNMTYREMIMTAFRESIDISFNELPFLEYLPKNHCYSFVLQHPANHIVIPIHIPKMYLVSVHEINDENNTATFVSPLEYQSWSIFDNLRDGIIYFPKQYIIDNSNSNLNPDEKITEYMKLIQIYASVHTPYHQMGLMFTNLNTGKRCSIINPNYEEMCKIRGNYTNIHYQYLCLRRINKVMEFLNHFPQYKSIFFGYKEQYETFINNIHESYISYYVKKSGKFISKKYFSIIYAIHHSIFLPSVKSSLQNGITDKIIIKHSVIKEYINQLDPGKILHTLNSERFSKNTTSDDPSKGINLWD
jgi:hypothetical protein